MSLHRARANTPKMKVDSIPGNSIFPDGTLSSGFGPNDLTLCFITTDANDVVIVACYLVHTINQFTFTLQ